MNLINIEKIHANTSMSSHGQTEMWQTDRQQTHKEFSDMLERDKKS